MSQSFEERDVLAEIDSLVKGHPAVLFMKGTPDFPQCGFSMRAAQILRALGVAPVAIDVLSDPEIRAGIKEYQGWPTIPQLYIGGELIGGSDIMMELYESGELAERIGSLNA